MTMINNSSSLKKCFEGLMSGHPLYLQCVHIASLGSQGHIMSYPFFGIRDPNYTALTHSLGGIIHILIDPTGIMRFFLRIGSKPIKPSENLLGNFSSLQIHYAYFLPSFLKTGSFFSSFLYNL